MSRQEPFLLREHSWGEDALADVLGVVLHLLEWVLLNDTLAAASLSQDWVHHGALVTRGVTESLRATERVERVVSGSITSKESLVWLTFWLLTPGNGAFVLSVTCDTLITHAIRVTQIHCRAGVDETIRNLQVTGVDAREWGKTNFVITQSGCRLVERL